MSMATSNHVERARREGVLFGIPLGDLGWFQSLLMGVATGMAAFFLATFLAIAAMLVYMVVAGAHPDFALTYRRVGLPAGIVVMALALLFLGIQWSRRMMKKMRRA